MTPKLGASTETVEPAASPDRRYVAAAVVLHWLAALLILTQLGLAWGLATLPEDSPQQNAVERVHISVGVTILVVMLTRLAVRLNRRPPALPAAFSARERGLAEAAHWSLYALVFGLVFTGWALKSFSGKALTVWGVAAWPPLPFLSLLTRAQGRPVYETLELVHGRVLSWSLIALVVVHVGAALAHQFDGKPVLWRMIPFLRKPAP